MVKHGDELQEAREDLAFGDFQPPIPGLHTVGWAHFTAAKPGSLAAHHHAGAFELCLIRRGTVRWWAGERRFDVPPGHLYLTQPHQAHGGSDDIMDPCELDWVIFELDRRRGSFGMHPVETRRLDDRLRAIGSTMSPGPARLEAHFTALRAAYHARDVDAAVRVRAHMALLLCAVVRAFDEHRPAAEHPHPSVARAQRWIEAHLAEPIAIEEVAAAVDLSTSQFRHVFRQATGAAPQEYLLRRRIERARHLLATTDAAITEIALDCGFTTSQYFATAFKKQTGMTPRAWRDRAN